MSFTLLSDRVAILPDEAPKEKTTDSGLVIPLGDAGPLRPVYGEVRHVGIGHRSEHSSQLVPIDVEVGRARHVPRKQRRRVGN